jgi:hypothetical protein
MTLSAKTYALALTILSIGGLAAAPAHAGHASIGAAIAPAAAMSATVVSAHPQMLGANPQIAFSSLATATPILPLPVDFDLARLKSDSSLRGELVDNSVFSVTRDAGNPSIDSILAIPAYRQGTALDTLKSRQFGDTPDNAIGPALRTRTRNPSGTFKFTL